MYTVQDIQRRYNVTVHTVLQWIHSGELKAVNVGRTPEGKKPRWRVSEQALAEFEAKRTSMPAVPRAKRRKRPADVIEFYK
jgi:excisionase family DNA binding protein